jgi:hypothetical protein
MVIISSTLKTKDIVDFPELVENQKKILVIITTRLVDVIRLLIGNKFVLYFDHR